MLIFVTLVITCDDPGEVDHGMILSTAPYLCQSSVVYSCDSGYELMGVATISCQLDGEWSDDPPTCQEIGKKYLM